MWCLLFKLDTHSSRVLRSMNRLLDNIVVAASVGFFSVFLAVRLFCFPENVFARRWSHDSLLANGAKCLFVTWHSRFDGVDSSPCAVASVQTFVDVWVAHIVTEQAAIARIPY
ncbi:hypothetical protein EVAR_71770_1 [Eumeta japonica]|uniref:Uncharacterized protein n=1 Tax=Eumeta variegata TaxID=151549 RepID=A0A4C1SUF1_EUMVA|nr:hypothetical protein EVAR_71770_1 [Eumeta japonica]